MQISSIGEAWDVKILDSLFDPSAPPTTKDKKRPAFYRKRESTLLYKVYIYLSGGHLSMVENVVYNMHPSVTPQQVRVRATSENPTCKLNLMLWGTFQLTALVTMRTGDVITLTHHLTFDRDIRAEGVEFTVA